MISVIIFTKNEELDLPQCLDSLSWSDDIHVVDSNSTDKTVSIAKSYGATVSIICYDNNLPFGGDEAEHRNNAFSSINFKYDWIYYCDADERPTEELISKLKLISENDATHNAYRIQRHDYYLGTWLKYVTPSPFNIRFIRKGCVNYERKINPVQHISGTTGELSEHFDHFSFSKGFDHWFAKHNSYSALEAKQIISNRQNNAQWSFLGAFFEKDRNKRRFNQKELFYRLPCRPLIKFLILYVLRRGFLDGYAGFSYAILQSIYEYMIVLKTHELEVPNLNLNKRK